jgi:cell division ATPase FtsA
MELLRLLKFKKIRSYLGFDLGRGSVKGFVFEKDNIGRTIVSFSDDKIERFGVFDGKDFEFDIVKKSIEKVIKELKLKNAPELEKLVSFSPEILRAAIFTFFFKRESSEKIKEKEAEEIERSASENAIKNLKEKLKEKGVGDFRVVKSRIVERKILGYWVPILEGFEGSEVELKVLVVYSANHYLLYIDKLKDFLGIKEEKIFHPVEGLIDYLGHDYKIFSESKQKGVFIDIGERTTTLLSFKEGIDSFKSFLLGGYDFTKKISEKLGVSESRADVLKEDMFNNKLTKEVNSKIAEIIKPVLIVWLKQVAKIVMNKRVYLYGGGSLLPPLQEGLKQAGADEVVYLKPEHLLLKNKTKVAFSPKETSALLLSFVKENNY